MTERTSCGARQKRRSALTHHLAVILEPNADRPAATSAFGYGIRGQEASETHLPILLAGAVKMLQAIAKFADGLCQYFDA
jgi:hypothetical protein